MSFRLSVLDQSPIAAGSTGAAALRNSIDLAQCAEEAGYHRYWVAEHHGTPMLACASPEVLIGAIAAATGRIRVGSGGVDAPALQPAQGRRDVQHVERAPSRSHRSGGRAPRRGAMRSPRLRCSAIGGIRRRTISPSSSPSCWRMCRNRCRPITASRASPRCPAAQRGPTSGCLARPLKVATGPPSWGCRTRLPTSSIRGGAAIAADYQQHFTPSVVDPSTAGDGGGVDPLRGHGRRGRAARLEQPDGVHTVLAGDLIPVPPVETALDFLARHPGSVESLGRRRRSIVGSPTTVRSGIEALVAEYRRG